MAIVLMSINGVGLGHLSRMVEIAEYIHDEGERPVLFYQSKSFPFSQKNFHKVQIDSLQKAAPEYLDTVADRVNTACHLSEPGIYIEDTHPAKIKLKEDIVKLMVVRPTTLAYLIKLRDFYADQYDAFLIADDPASPTWPYNEEETAMLATWKQFYIIGPIFRKPAPGGIQKAKTKYNWKADIQLFVFSMGGGGQHAGADDVEVFVRKISDLSTQIRAYHPQARLLFVKGPLFPADALLPEGVEIVPVEEDMPSLFAIAHTAVIRPGFNSTWECINVRTPFYFIEGTTYSEPIREKLSKLETLGLASNSKIFDEAYRRAYVSACRQVSARWTGKPNENFMKVIAQAPNFLASRTKPRVSYPLIDETTLADTLRKFREASSLISMKKFFLRIDDVVEMTEELRFILALTSRLNIFSSLEVIPYLCRLTEEELCSFDPHFERLIVAQHGYGHVVNLHNPPNIRSEFQFSLPGSVEEVNHLLQGKNFLQKKFPRRFHGGFSAPFDCFPAWLPPTLQEGGWEYMLTNLPKYQASRIRSYRARVDVWSWEEARMKTLEQLLERILSQVTQDGYFGMILHPLHFRVAEHRNFLALLLSELTVGGYQSPNFLQYVAAN